MAIKILLSGGGDEQVAAKRLLYLRDPTGSELDEDPMAMCVVRLAGVALTSLTPRDVLAAKFAARTEIVRVTAPNGARICVRGAAVVDVDDPPSTSAPGANAWLVFGVGPRAPRLAVRETRDMLRETWLDAGLDPAESGV